MQREIYFNEISPLVQSEKAETKSYKYYERMKLFKELGLKRVAFAS